jgi:NADH dehydrogenase
MESPLGETRRRVVILGCGFGGLSVARTLAHAPVELTVIDQRNYHMFQPLLYQVATAGLSPADIAQPIRGLIGKQRNTRVLLGRVTGIDPLARSVAVDGHSVPYDVLVVATGSVQSWFGHDEWREAAPGLKTIEDALVIRRRILLAFERAEATDDPAERRRLLCFVVIGGGATGVEMAGAIATLARAAVVRDFRNINPAESRVILVEAGVRLLPAFPESLSDYAVRALTQLGVETRLGVGATDCDAGGIVLGGERIEARTIVWSAGVAASPAASWLQVPTDRSGRVEVTAELTVPARDDIYVIGDTAAAKAADGSVLPGVAPVAKQQGAYVGRRIDRWARTGRSSTDPFVYRDYGNLATIGRNRAVLQYGWLKLCGVLAWILWGFAHIFFLIGFRNRVGVVVYWLWSWATYNRAVRLITD